MPVIITEGKVALAELLSQGQPATIRLRLFKAPIPEIEGLTLPELVEADFSGYYARTINLWNAIQIASDSSGAVVDSFQKFVAGEGQGNDIFGHAFTLQVDGQAETILFVDRYPKPVSMQEQSQVHSVRATILATEEAA